MTHQLEFHAMGSKMLAIVDCDHEPASLGEMPARFEQWEQVLSRFRIDSELCCLNRRPGQATKVGAVLWDVFQAAQQMEQRTGGLVNPMILNALVHAGYDRNFGELISSGSKAELDLVGWTVPALDLVVADASEQSLCLPHGAELDFGGVAKGWAAQQAILMLSKEGPALFSAGGDIAISGPRADGAPWQIGVDDPFKQGGYVEMLFIERGGVATSGRDYRRWTRAGQDAHHIIDPRDGQPAQTDVLTATVVAPDAIIAEAMAKAVLIAGSEAGMAWLNSDDELSGLLVLENGKQVRTANLERYL